MAISKITLNGETQMDVTGKTVTAGSMLSGTTALKADGTDITGNIASKSSTDLTVSGATVTAPAGYYASAATKSVASGTAGTPTATKGTVSNHAISVTPSVTNSTGYITGETKTGTAVSVSVSELASGTLAISSSGTKDVTQYASVEVAAGSATTPATTITANPSISVSSGGLITATVSATKNVTPTVSAGFVSAGTSGIVTASGSNTSQLSTRSSSDLTASGATVTAPAGYYGSAATKSVAAGTEGTPTATKGTVSGHQVTVTPSVTNSAGYISGGTHTGTGVTVAASELVSGSQTLERNGTFDVTNLAQVLTSFPDGFNYETGTFSPSSDVATYNISFSRTHSWMPFFAMVVDVTGTYDSTTNTSHYMCYHNYLQAWSELDKMASSTNVYGYTHIAYRSAGTSSFVYNQYPFYYSFTNTSSTNQNYPRYWITETGIKAQTVSTAYWRAGRTYRWFAIWTSHVDPSWKIGAINTSSGANYDSTNRMRTEEYIPVNTSVRVVLNNGAKVCLIGLNNAHQFVESTSWISSSFNLVQQVSSMTNASDIAYVKLMASYSDNADITDIDDLIADVEITGMT